MRIIECYIENFGKISQKKYDFKSGLNCINSDNGSGKTTLAAFIKAMFYGMNDTKKLSLEENDRKHYLPWNGGIRRDSGKLPMIQKSVSVRSSCSQTDFRIF